MVQSISTSSGSPAARGWWPQRNPQMRHSRVNFASIAVLVLAALAVPRAALAAGKYPAHPLTMVVPVPARRGGQPGPRLVARDLAASPGHPLATDQPGGAPR